MGSVAGWHWLGRLMLWMEHVGCDGGGELDDGRGQSARRDLYLETNLFFISSSFLVDYVIWRAGVKENSILSSWPATSRHHRSWLAWFPDGAL